MVLGISQREECELRFEFSDMPNNFLSISNALLIVFYFYSLITQLSSFEVTVTFTWFMKTSQCCYFFFKCKTVEVGERWSLVHLKINFLRIILAEYSHIICQACFKKVKCKKLQAHLKDKLSPKMYRLTDGFF